MNCFLKSYLKNVDAHYQQSDIESLENRDFCAKLVFFAEISGIYGC